MYGIVTVTLLVVYDLSGGWHWLTGTVPGIEIDGLLVDCYLHTSADRRLR